MMLRTATLALCAAAGLAPLACAAPASAAEQPAPQGATIIGRTWHMEAHGALAPSARTANFTIAPDGTLSGYDGCNEFGGHAHVDSVNRTIDITGNWSTRRGCVSVPSATLATTLDKVINEGHLNYFTVDGVLLLTNESGEQITFML